MAERPSHLCRVNTSLYFNTIFTIKYTERWGINVPLIALDNVGQKAINASLSSLRTGEISRSSGNPLELVLPTSNWKRWMGHSNQMGTVKMHEIGQPACSPPKSPMAAHGGASETERISADNDNLANLSQLKVQSKLSGNGRHWRKSLK